MDNTKSLGAQMQAAAARDKSQEERIQALEAQVQRLTMLAKLHIDLIAKLRAPDSHILTVQD